MEAITTIGRTIIYLLLVLVFDDSAAPVRRIASARPQTERQVTVEPAGVKTDNPTANSTAAGACRATQTVTRVTRAVAGAVTHTAAERPADR